ncbi:LOW QUALITY PROTEIN: uncharacterized protein C6orf163 homolog [Aegotheles albertisi]
MIGSPDLDCFVCCAVCSKIIPPPPPSNTTFDWIQECKPFRRQYCTHRDILEAGAFVQQEQHKKGEAEIQERIEKMKAELWSQEEVRKANAEMQQYMEDEQKREAEAADRPMAQRLQCTLMECAWEKMQVVAQARKQERKTAQKEAAKRHRKHCQQLKEETMLAEELCYKSIEQLNKKCHEINIALSITEKENRIETEKQLREAETLHPDELEKVMVMLKAAGQVKILTQKLDKMTDWKDSLETEIQATRQAFQKYIDVAFPKLFPGQADFILPCRKAFEQKGTPEEAQGSDKEYKRTDIRSVRFTGVGKQNYK